ncbi:MAG: TlpA family protein disulfide reductase [Deltaproteobacteria bacterium]|nr:TlpA family protein disulfide reductase [Deltaproteobacteria bacterium]
MRAPEPSGLPLARVARWALGLAAVAAGVLFGMAALDGERRRDARLVELLAPDYTGDDRRAPDFTLPDRHGRLFRLSSLRGRTVVLHFWSSDCPPCVRELSESLPAFDEIVRSRPDLALVLVTVDRDWDAVAALVPPGLRAPLLFDPERRVVNGRFGTRLFPETWVIDPRGVLRARFDHTLSWESPVLTEYLSTFR